ncbi:MAG TPA: YciI family protein [Polyangiaceae bacterium]|nr:YciI family protein [Polyangiaceae bacterium]
MIRGPNLEGRRKKIAQVSDSAGLERHTSGPTGPEPEMMMRFLVLIGHDEKGGKSMSTEQHQALYTGYQRYEAELKQAGVLLGGEPLQPSASAVRLSTEGGKRKVLDGPFSESKEIIGGYFILEVKSREEAIEWAARCPAAQLGAWSYVEVREIQEIPR